MTENEIKVLKMNLLGGMHSYMMNCVGDEECQDSWLQLGVPDEPTEEDLENIAEDEDDFIYTANLFGKLVLENFKNNN
jgi:hypothetical protein